jgi:ubiquinone/menaquinone biosynthesis C-methylase UbiE
MISSKILNNLICIKCGGKLESKDDKFVCAVCKEEYPIIHDKLQATSNPIDGFGAVKKDFIFNNLKGFFKKYPKIYHIIYLFFGACFVGKSSKKLIKDIDSEKIILNLGSGTKKIRKDVINIDFYPFINVDIVADIHNLPIKDNSADVIINEAVLEHDKNPQSMILEMYRILKPDGLIYVTVPFIASFHSSPNDYYRWTKEGLREALNIFQELKIGIICGPTSAMLSIFNEWLATFFSFGFKYLHQFLLILFTVISSPLKLLDYLISKFPSAQNIAFGFYFIGKKR